MERVKRFWAKRPVEIPAVIAVTAKRGSQKYGRYLCSKCQRTFFGQQCLLHILEEHEQHRLVSLFNCSLCNFCSKSVIDVQKHLQETHSSEDSAEQPQILRAALKLGGTDATLELLEHYFGPKIRILKTAQWNEPVSFKKTKSKPLETIL